MKIGDEIVIIVPRGDRLLHRASVDLGQIGIVSYVYKLKVSAMFTGYLGTFEQTVDQTTVMPLKGATALEKAIYGL